ncbi:substrate-binding domain-containing protein [Halomonas sp.]|uniref:substrate-binding domain-containing protein n=1 Tax=Halomonas sp. TaxID=1486246 RepID=UPI0023579438|nr:substrate-binding domain-containing protein [Halomonas sp.]
MAYLAGQPGSSTDRQRHAGFVEGLASEGLACHALEVGNYRYSDACHAARLLFTSSSPPDALFAANDLMAIAAMETVRHEFGLRVPSDVSVIGFDDVPMAAWPSHSLTTLQQPVELMVLKATELLMRQVNQLYSTPEQITLPVTPMLRNSTRHLLHGADEN